VLVPSILSLAILGAGVMAPLGPAERRILEVADNVVCVFFLADFLYSRAKAANRWRTLRTRGWLDLLSSIPAVDALRVGRMARVLRIIRVLRGIRAARVLADALMRRRAEGTFLAATLASIILFVLGGVAILHFDTVPGANIRSPEDALWWTVVTLPTVGCGDRYPVTPEGRALAVALMVAGVGLFGTFSGVVASWFLKPSADAASD
jgi:voltage-gated potassium channel